MLKTPTYTTRRDDRPSNRGHSTVPTLWLVCCVSAGLWLLLRGSPGQYAATPPAAADVVQSVGFVPDSISSGAFAQVPIERVRVGRRVITPGSSPLYVLPTAVDPHAPQGLPVRPPVERPPRAAAAGPGHGLAQALQRGPIRMGVGVRPERGRVPARPGGDLVSGLAHAASGYAPRLQHDRRGGARLLRLQPRITGS